VIDWDIGKIESLRDEGMTYVEGDATSDSTLEKANLTEAKGLVVVLGSDSDNVFVIMSARTMNPELFITSRCSVDDSSVKMKRAGADKVVNPYVAGGHKMADLLVEPILDDTAELKAPNANIDLAIEEIKVSALNSISGKAIRESGLREDYGILVAGLLNESGDVIVSPGPETVLSPDQTVILMGRKESLKRLNDSS
jgi:voltage-gated potassium channel